MGSDDHKKEEWLGLLKDKMSHHAEPVPKEGWSALEQAMALGKQTLLGRRWPRLVSIVSTAVAVILLCWFLFPISSLVQTEEVPQLAVVAPDKEDIEKANVEKTNESEESQSLDTLFEDPVVFLDSIPEKESVAWIEEICPEKNEEVHPAKSDGPGTLTWEEYLNMEPESVVSSEKNDHWLALSVGNTGVGVFDPRVASVVTAMPMMSASASLVEGGVKDLMPYKRPDKLEISPRAEAIVPEYRHKQPLSFGVKFGKTFSDKFTLETGLVYSLLRSDVDNLQKDKTLRQTLHYLGIPLRFNWNFVHKPTFAVYAGIGGMVEKCVYGELDNEKLKIKSVQTSLNLAVGIQYKFTPMVGIYFEPGLSYYLGMKEDGSLGALDNGTLIKSIHSENPLGFTLQAGFRFSF